MSHDAPPASSHPRAWVARHPVVAFLLPVFVLGWPALAVVAHARRGHGPGGGVALGQPFEHWLGLALVLLFLVPSALGVSAAANGARGVRALLRRAVQWRGAVRWTIGSVVALPLLALASALLAGGVLRPAATLAAAGAYLWSVATRTLVINLWEELAWSGFVQWRLQERRGALAAALLTAVPFAAIHLPLQILDGGPLLPAFVGLLVLSIVFRALLGVVLDATRGSVLAAGVVHAAFNSTANREGAIHAAVAGVDASLHALGAALLLAAALALLLRTRRRVR